MNYYIQGDAANADQINAAFEKLGYDTTGHLFNAKSVLYFTLDGGIRATTCNCTPAIIKTHPDYKELELPKPHYDISNFKAGMPVLVRDYDNTQWRYVQFSHCVGKDNPIMFNACGNTWEQCIPFEGNEHLLGTTDMPSEEYINW
jgi:hypothetical protein